MSRGILWSLISTDSLEKYNDRKQIMPLLEVDLEEVWRKHRNNMDWLRKTQKKERLAVAAKLYKKIEEAGGEVKWFEGPKDIFAFKMNRNAKMNFFQDDYHMLKKAVDDLTLEKFATGQTESIQYLICYFRRAYSDSVLDVGYNIDWYDFNSYLKNANEYIWHIVYPGIFTD